MNVEAGSIMAHLYKLFPVKVYRLDVPENFDRPSMYFPPALSFDSNDTNMTFMKTYVMNVKLFHHDSQKAHDEAERIADAIRVKKNAIPLLDPEGEPTDQSVRLTRMETRIADAGVAEIIFNWDSRYYYEREKYNPLETIEIEGGLKS